MGYLLSMAQTSNDIYVCGPGVYSQNTQEGQRIYHVGYTSSHSNLEVKQKYLEVPYREFQVLLAMQ